MKGGVPGSREGVMWNLREAGCSEAQIARFLALAEADDAQSLMGLLCCHRCQLLERLHRDQRQIDCLDALIYEIKRTHGGTKQ